MPSPDVQLGVAALLEQCAQRRAGALALAYQDHPAQLARMLQAEAAGRELMAALVRPDPFPELSLGASLRRLVGYLQTVISASTPDEQQAPLLSARVHHAAVSVSSARLLCDAALLLILAAIDDEASDVEIRLERGETGARLSVESDRPAVADELPALEVLRSEVLAGGGEWNAAPAPHGASWIVRVTMPFEQACDWEASYGT